MVTKNPICRCDFEPERCTAHSGKPTDIPQEFRIPTREEHRRSVRRIWISCICIGLFVISTMTGIVAVMVLKQMAHQLIVSCTTVLFQIIIGGVFTGFTTPYFLETRVNFAVGMEMNRKALELGTTSADALNALQGEIKPMIEKGDRVLTKVDGIVDEFQKKDLSKLHDAVDRLTKEMDGGGKLDRLVSALEKIAARTSEKADDQIESLLGEAWQEETPTTPPPVDSQSEEHPTTAAAPDRDGS